MLRGREISPVQVARAMVDRTERLEPTLGAYITFTPEAALVSGPAGRNDIS